MSATTRCLRRHPPHPPLYRRPVRRYRHTKITVRRLQCAMNRTYVSFKYPLPPPTTRSGVIKTKNHSFNAVIHMQESPPHKRFLAVLQLTLDLSGDFTAFYTRGVSFTPDTRVLAKTHGYSGITRGWQFSGRNHTFPWQ